jgi:hypothetical protein
MTADRRVIAATDAVSIVACVGSSGTFVARLIRPLIPCESAKPSVGGPVRTKRAAADFADDEAAF